MEPSNRTRLRTITEWGRLRGAAAPDPAYIVLTGLLVALALAEIPVGACASADIFEIADRPVTLNARLRSREEIWNFFGPGSQLNGQDGNRYHFLGNQLRLGIGYEFDGIRIELELMSPFLINLPDNAFASAPQGALGLGANYFKPNGNSNDASVFLKQGFIEFGDKLLPGLTIKGGRFEFFGGTEFMPADAQLRWLVLNRIQQRLVGNFGFTHVTRSFDAIMVSYGDRNWQVTAIYAVPTKGVFDLQGLEEVRGSDMVYVSLNAGPGVLPGNSIGRLFYIYYHDGRGLAPVDNRSPALRDRDRRVIEIHTIGVDYATTLAVGPGVADLMVWGAGQLGSWGRLEQKSYAIVGEAGYRLPKLWLKPWLRFGYTATSGDSHSNDSTHGTFFQILPTPRKYAKFPFFNMMNLNDAMAQVILTADRGVSLETSLHGLWLSSSRDLWYAGGGEFNNNLFGFAGRPSFGRSYLATLFDFQLKWRMTNHVSTVFYYAHAFGGSVIAANFPGGREADFGYIEVTLSL